MVPLLSIKWLAHPTSLSLFIFLSSQLALKHRQNKLQRQRIILFVGSPIADDEASLVALGKKLKKNSVAIDIVSFGEDEQNEDKLAKFVEAANSGENW